MPDARDVFYALVGAAIGIGVVLTYQSNRGPTSFDACVLAETKGRQKEAFSFAVRLCRQKFPPVTQ